MKLFSAPLSPFAARVRISIYRKGLDGIEIVLPPEGLKSAAYLALNPLGQIPALQTESGTVIPESAAIIEYLEDRFPTPSLRPTDPELLALARLFMRLPDIHFQNAPRILLGMRMPQQRQADAVSAAFENLQRGLGYIDHYVNDGPWAVGDAASIADSALIPVLNAVDLVGRVYDRPGLLVDYPRLGRYWDQARHDPVHARVIAEQLDAVARLNATPPAAG